MSKELNIFGVLKELDISVWEFLEAPDMLTDSGKILFILTFKAIRKAQKVHASKREGKFV